ncbi:hypothetical protein ACFRIC_16040 [Streptomyces sp. NPDC056738]|uniref:DUF7224 domain-containing protein n=1 Tax=Streptomyces sp. NPDC056738 TaxID=3345933 RepID=UPI00369CD692
MKFRVALRSGIAIKAAPVVILLTLFYYFTGETVPPSSFDGFAPAVVAAPLMTLYPLAYAVTASMAIWESGRLRSGGVWELAPARSRFAIALNVLVPVISAGWLVILMPPAISLIRAEVLPSWDSLRLPAMAMVVCLAYAMIGFAIGLKTKPIITAPITAVTLWVVIAFSRSVQPYWIRHTSGLFSDLVFGEVPSVMAITPPILFAGGISLALSILWLPIRATFLRIVISTAVAVGGMGGAYGISHNWPHDPPLLAGQVSMRCVGQEPMVCMPEATAKMASTVQRDASEVLDALKDHGMEELPSRIMDSYAEGRFPQTSSNRIWHLNLTTSARQDRVRFQIATAAVRFPCTNVDLLRGHAAWYWAASVTGQQGAYEARVAQEEVTAETKLIERQVHGTVRQVLKKSRQEQANWYYGTLAAACGKES